MKKALLSVFCAAFVLAMVGFATPASAQEGFYVGTGIGLGFPSWGSDMDDLGPENALALEIVHLGYNFTPNWGVGLQWGALSGELDDVDDGIYGEGYISLSGRYTITNVDFALQPYVEFGLGTYNAMAEGEDGPYDVEIELDPAIGVRLALGGQYFINKIYIAPELSYHIVEFDDGEVDHDLYGEADFDDAGKGDFLLLLVKVGYAFNKE